jgi:hypothetical protein
MTPFSVFKTMILGLGLSSAAFSPSLAQPPSDLCEIPFTEMHRAALEREHIPGLQEIFEHWRASGPDQSRIGYFGKRDLEEQAAALKALRNHIKAAKTVEANQPVDPELPKRHGPQHPQNELQGFNYEDVVFVLDPDRQARFDAAMQALLHWSCTAYDPKVFEQLAWSVIKWRGDLNATDDRYPLTFEDWKQKSLITYSQMARHPKPLTEDVPYLAIIARHLITFEWDPAWWQDKARVNWRWQFQVDFADWILGSDGALEMKIRLVTSEAVSWRDAGLLDPAGPAIAESVLTAYLETVSLRKNKLLLNDADRVILDLELARLSTSVHRPDRALCFILSAERFFKASSYTPTLEARDLHHGIYTSVTVGAERMFGTSWRDSIKPISPPCYPQIQTTDSASMGGN